MADHWEVIHIIDSLNMVNNGPNFPTGVFFSPNHGSLPVPTGSAREFVVQRTRRVRAISLAVPPNLCTTVGQAALIAGLSADYELFSPTTFTDYLISNCQQIQQVIANRTTFQRMKREAVAATKRLRPALLAFTFGDEGMLDAIIKITIAFFFDSDGGRFVFV